MAKLVAFRFREWMALQDVGGVIPDNVLVVAGKNRSGKTPLLRAIDTLIYGPKAAPDMPIRAGETQAVRALAAQGHERMQAHGFVAGVAHLHAQSRARRAILGPDFTRQSHALSVEHVGHQVSLTPAQEATTDAAAAVGPVLCIRR